MKCLARLGDTRKMIEFAQLARDPNLFVLAANYLRSALTWQNDPAILKAIVTFYRKARKLEPLSNFFVECSNHTIDSSGDYHRGIGLLGEALKQLAANTKVDTTDLEQMIRHRAIKIKSFIDLREQSRDNRIGTISEVESLLASVQSDDNHPVRISDVAGLLVEFHAQNDVTNALEYARLIQKMQQGSLSDFISGATIQKLKNSKETDSTTSFNSDEIVENIR